MRTSTKSTGDNAWSMRGIRVDEAKFCQGQVGPYRLGPLVRRTEYGGVSLALQEGRLGVVEIDLFEHLAGSDLTAPDGPLMGDLAEVAGVEHRHIATIIGCGFDEGVPYVVRRHRLGVTLASLLERAETIPDVVAITTLFAAAEAVDFLAAQGSRPGACSLGGFDERDIFLGFDGRIELLGMGMQSARSREDPLAADLQSCFELARSLDEASGARLASATAGARTAKELAKSVRRRAPEACALYARPIAGVLRMNFADQIRKDRKFFGLSSLH